MQPPVPNAPIREQSKLLLVVLAVLFFTLIGVILTFAIWTFPMTINSTTLPGDAVKAARELARRGSPVTLAIEKAKREDGKWPSSLERVESILGAPVKDFGWWVYGQEGASFKLQAAGNMEWYLYYQPEFGWLLANTPDHRPMVLGFKP